MSESSRSASHRPVALVTGASMGIGLEFARLLARDGYDLILTARSRQLLDEVAAELSEKYGVRATVFAHDLSNAEDLKTLFSEVEAGNFDIEVLINNAGFGDHGFFVDSDWDKQNQMIQLNVTALTALLRHFGEKMAARRSGHILNLASTAAFQPGPMMSVYFATKAYVLSLSQAVGNELADRGVTVTALCPGPTKSNFKDTAKVGHTRLFESRAVATAEEVAKFGYAAMMKGESVAIHGLVNRVMVESIRLVPRDLLTKITRQIVQ